MDVQSVDSSESLSIDEDKQRHVRLQQMALLAEAKRNLAKADANPSTVISHEALKRLLTKQRIMK